MRIALPCWNGRVSPVFDVSRRLRVVDIEGGAISRNEEIRLENESRVAKLEGLDVEVLICAAISRPLEAACWVAGVQVVPEVNGPVDDVIDAVLEGSFVRTLDPAVLRTRVGHDSGEAPGRPGENVPGRAGRRGEARLRRG